MQEKLRSYGGRLLFASNVFIAFLLAFEQWIVLPVWLQVAGRLHPLLLHFPLVIILLSMCLELWCAFRTEKDYESGGFLRDPGFRGDILLAGALTCALTVVMGLFLSREEGYGGDALLWHKWTGAGVFFMVSILYWLRNSAWYSGIPVKSGVLLVLLSLVLTGHYGAQLTHGEDFILAPALAAKQSEQVSLEEALVFPHLVLPVLEQKCTGCHNSRKQKGELVLTDRLSIEKGGKSGKLFVPGNPEVSLLLERIHLPEGDEKRMPPGGKLQLTLQEKALLAAWIKGGAEFDRKVTALEETDSLRLLATQLLKPRGPGEQDKYEFPAAAEARILELNNDYRTITPVAAGSPGLTVNVYNRAAYSEKQLQELEGLKSQIVFLNLSKLPVSEASLKTIAQFENLRDLDLNFTDITGAGLTELAALKHLRRLRLSGTRVTAAGLMSGLAVLKKLESVSVWNTGLSQDDFLKLKEAYPHIRVEGASEKGAQAMLKLNPPVARNRSTVFETELPLELRHPVNDVVIRYTMDGTEPDSINSPVFEGIKMMNEPVIVKARAFKDGWYGSETVNFECFKSGIKPDSTILLTPLNRVHQAEGAYTFFDHKLGKIEANNPAWANNWAGVRNNEMALLSEFRKPVKISSVGLHYMIEEDTGIFPPESVEIWGGDDKDKLRLIARFKASMPSKGDAPSLRALENRFKPQEVTYLKIVARPLEKIPDWHRSKGKRALLLIDEMFLN